MVMFGLYFIVPFLLTMFNGGLAQRVIKKSAVDLSDQKEMSRMKDLAKLCVPNGVVQTSNFIIDVITAEQIVSYGTTYEVAFVAEQKGCNKQQQRDRPCLNMRCSCTVLEPSSVNSQQVTNVFCLQRSS